MARAIGLMSGTSLDGVAAAWIETDGTRVEATGPALTLPYDDALRADLREILDRAPTLSPDDPALLDATARMTRVHAEAVRALAQPADILGFHGQTILHRPELRRTWQIGDAALLASLTGLPVAWDFRSADVAAGGQGAPFAPIYHASLASGLTKPVCFLNLGGVANLSFVGAGADLLAFDTGPANALLDDWVHRHTGARYDADGALAASGRADEAVLARLLDNQYLRRPGPKSLDRLDFHGALEAVAGLSLADGAATLAAFTARTVAAALPHLPARPLRWLVCGGGRLNAAIMDALRAELGVPVDPVEAEGWDGDAIEAQCFALLAERVRLGLPLSFPGTTGVPRPMPGGRIAFPD